MTDSFSSKTSFTFLWNLEKSLNSLRLATTTDRLSLSHPLSICPCRVARSPTPFWLRCWPCCAVVQLFLLLFWRSISVLRLLLRSLAKSSCVHPSLPPLSSRGRSLGFRGSNSSPWCTKEYSSRIHTRSCSLFSSITDQKLCESVILSSTYMSGLFAGLARGRTPLQRACSWRDCRIYVGSRFRGCSHETWGIYRCLGGLVITAINHSF